MEQNVIALGGTIHNGKAYFQFEEAVSKDGEDITLPAAVEIERKMLEMGYAGALIGSQFDEGDFHYIHFEL